MASACRIFKESTSLLTGLGRRRISSVSNQISSNDSLHSSRYFMRNFDFGNKVITYISRFNSSHVGEPFENPTLTAVPRRFKLPFEEYQKLKRSVRSRQRLAGVPFAFVGLGTSSVLSAYMFPDMFDATPETVQLIMGLDPLVFCGICGVVSCGVGYVAGTSLFGVVWKWMNKELAYNMEVREKDFLERLQSRRFSDFSKFEDDYYGESIKTLGDYRQWLRTQQKKAEDAKQYFKENKLGENDQSKSAESS